MQPIARYFFILTLLLAIGSYAEPKSPWPKGAQAAVVLTYDDALNSQLDTAIPQLDHAGLKATFYLSPLSTNVTTRLQEWRKASRRGHELANHMVYHPCRKYKPDDWVPADYDLKIYTLSRYVNEVKMANKWLFAIDGETERTFAYTCGHLTVKEEASVVNEIKPLFVAARGVSNQGLNDPKTMDYFNIQAQDVSGHRGAELIAMAKAAREKNQLLVLLFHGVGAEHLSVSAQAHQQLVDFLKKNKKTYWVVTLKEAVTYAKSLP